MLTTSEVSEFSLEVRQHMVSHIHSCTHTTAQHTVCFLLGISKTDRKHTDSSCRSDPDVLIVQAPSRLQCACAASTTRSIRKRQASICWDGRLIEASDHHVDRERSSSTLNSRKTQMYFVYVLFVSLVFVEYSIYLVSVGRTVLSHAHVI